MTTLKLERCLDSFLKGILFKARDPAALCIRSRYVKYLPAAKKLFLSESM